MIQFTFCLLIHFFFLSLFNLIEFKLHWLIWSSLCEWECHTIERLYFPTRPIVIPGPLFLAVSTVICGFGAIYFDAVCVQHLCQNILFLTVDLCSSMRFKQPAHIMATALLFCAITLPIQRTTHWSPFQGCIECTWYSVILHLYYFWPKLYSVFHFKLSFFSSCYIRFAITP